MICLYNFLRCRHLETLFVFQEKEMILKQASNLLYKTMVMVSRFDYNQSLRVNRIYFFCIKVYKNYHNKGKSNALLII